MPSVSGEHVALPRVELAVGEPAVASDVAEAVGEVEPEPPAVSNTAAISRAAPKRSRGCPNTPSPRVQARGAAPNRSTAAFPSYQTKADARVFRPRTQSPAGASYARGCCRRYRTRAATSGSITERIRRIASSRLGREFA